METTANSTTRRNTGAIPTGFFLTLILVAMVVAAWFVDPGFNWILVAVLMIAFVAVLGVATNGRAAGILINEQKLMSLSRFQMVLWTIIIVSGYFVIAIGRIGEVANPLLVGIDPNVWILLGISATSLVGSPMLLSNKKQKEPADKTKSFGAANKAYGYTQEVIDANRVGVLYGNADVSEARFTDIFEGDEIANTTFIDVAKVQMFFFTAVVAIAYSAELLHLIMVSNLAVDNVALPLIDEGLVTLMGISNAGYLGAKMITQTPSTA
jgi:hypothetical protein